MLPNHRNNGTGKNPFVGRFCRVVVVNSATRRVTSIDCVTGSAIGRIGYSRIDPSIVQAGKSTRLINNAGQCVGKTGVSHPI